MKQEGYNRLRCARTGGISADLLKLTAIITMLIDHIGAGILERLLIDGYVTDYALYLKIYQLDSVLRIIGRISFPIFCLWRAISIQEAGADTRSGFLRLPSCRKSPSTCSSPAA